MRSSYSRHTDKGPIFMGNGEVSSSKAFSLLSRLMRAFDDLSAAQQGMDVGCLDENNEDLAKDLVFALTGKKIKLK